MPDLLKGTGVGHAGRPTTLGGLLTRLAGRGPRRMAFGAAIGVVAGVAIFLAVSHSGADSSLAKGTSTTPAVTAPSGASATPSSGKPGSGPAPAATPSAPGSSSANSNAHASAPAAGSAGHGQSAASTPAATSASTNGVRAERSHALEATSFSIT